MATRIPLRDALTIVTSIEENVDWFKIRIFAAQEVLNLNSARRSALIGHDVGED